MLTLLSFPAPPPERRGELARRLVFRGCGVCAWSVEHKFQDVMFIRCLLVCINRSLGLGKVCTTLGSNLSFSRAVILR